MRRSKCCEEIAPTLLDEGCVARANQTSCAAAELEAGDCERRIVDAGSNAVEPHVRVWIVSAGVVGEKNGLLGQVAIVLPGGAVVRDRACVLEREKACISAVRLGACVDASPDELNMHTSLEAKIGRVIWKRRPEALVENKAEL